MNRKLAAAIKILMNEENPLVFDFEEVIAPFITIGYAQNDQPNQIMPLEVPIELMIDDINDTKFFISGCTSSILDASKGKYLLSTAFANQLNDLLVNKNLPGTWKCRITNKLEIRNDITFYFHCNFPLISPAKNLAVLIREAIISYNTSIRYIDNFIDKLNNNIKIESDDFLIVENSPYNESTYKIIFES